MKLHRRGTRSRSRGYLWLFGVVLLFADPTGIVRATNTAQNKPPIPLLAYYYIWFEQGSWTRAKIDTPLLGRYSSDNAEVMRKHVALAKEAGIDGFCVSWKHTPDLDRRLKQLIEIADAQDFKLSIIYEGLDFDRTPLAADQVAADLDYFVAHFASDKAFSMFGQPVIVWSGTWAFSRDEVAKVTAPRRKKLNILASEKNVSGYQRLEDLVGGDAYYWSSVDPDTFPGYEEKLAAMGRAIHSTGGLWIAPAAVGFDARLVGGTQTVDRKNGATLRREMDAAVRSSPDAVGLISWNEFSENSHVEPSRNYGSSYLSVLADIRRAQGASVGMISSDESPEGPAQFNGILVIAGVSALFAASLVAIVWRSVRGREGRPPRSGAGPPTETSEGHVQV